MKIKQLQETTAGAVASVAMPIGKTHKRTEEAANPAQQAAIAVNMKKAGKKPKKLKENDEGYTEINSKSFLDDDFYAFDPDTKVLKGTWSHKSVGRRHHEYDAQQKGYVVVSGMKAKHLGLRKKSKVDEGGFDIPEIPRAPQPKPTPSKTNEYMDNDKGAAPPKKPIEKPVDTKPYEEPKDKKDPKTYMDKAVTKESSIFKGVSEAHISEEELLLAPGQGIKFRTDLLPKRTDHEVEMARNQLRVAAQSAKRIYQNIEDLSEIQGLDGWVQAKITKASDYLDAVNNYLDGKKQMIEIQDEVDEQVAGDSLDQAVSAQYNTPQAKAQTQAIDQAFASGDEQEFQRLGIQSPQQIERDYQTMLAKEPAQDAALMRNPKLTPSARPAQRYNPKGIPIREMDIEETQKLSAREKFKRGLKRAGYDPDAGADRLLNLIARQAEQRKEFEKQQAEKDAEFYGKRKEVPEGLKFHGGFPDVDHMRGAVHRDADMITDNVKTNNKRDWDRAVDSINARVFDDMAQFRTDSKGERAIGNSAVWAKWDNEKETGWFNAKGRPLKPWPVKEQGVAEGIDQSLSIQQLATISDEALDNAYGYGRSTPGNSFGWQANLMSAAYAKKMIDAGVTDIDQIADAIHKGWNVTARKFVQDPEQFDDTEKLRQAGKLEAKLQQRAKLMKINYAQLDNDEQEKDRVVARALLQAIMGQQDMAEGENWSKHNNPRAGGMSKKSVNSYRRSHPGSKIQTAVTTKPSKLKKGSKSAKRRKSFCARMRGMKKHRTGAKTARDPNSNINKSLRRWNCESVEEMRNLLMLAEQKVAMLRENENIEENLHKWFKEKWVRFGPDGKIRGDCARGDDSEGKPKCLPQSKAHSLGKKGRASAGARKRREDPNPERSGKAINVATKKKSNEGVAEGADEGLSKYSTERLQAYVKKVSGGGVPAFGSGAKLKRVQAELKRRQQGVAEEEMPKYPVYTAKDLPEPSLGTTVKANLKQMGYDNPYYGVDGPIQDARKEERRIAYIDTDGVGYDRFGNPRYTKDKPSLSRNDKTIKAVKGLLGIDESVAEGHELCPECGGAMYSEEMINEKKDACYYKVKSRYKVWPSAYASGALVKCRKSGSKNWGNKSK